jgi:hypothetical protein
MIKSETGAGLLDSPLLFRHKLWRAWASVGSLLVSAFPLDIILYKRMSSLAACAMRTLAFGLWGFIA